MSSQPIQENERCSVEPATDSAGATSSSSGIIKPSFFKAGSSAHSSSSGGSILAPSKFHTGANPWQSPNADKDSKTEGHQASLANNPFAEKSHHAVSTSDSEQEEKERPVVAPGHNFRPTRQGLLKASALGGVGSGSSAKSPSKCLLRPSALDRQTQQLQSTASSQELASNPSKTSFKLAPPKLQNPFTVKDTGQSNKENEAETESSADLSLAQKSVPSESSLDSNSTQLNLQEENKKFVFGENLGDRVVSAVSNSLSATSSDRGDSDRGGFVFGENLTTRVNHEKSQENETADESNDAQCDDSSAATESNEGSGTVKSLQESAAAEQAKHTITVPDEVAVKTGEEDESNVFQLNAKLFAFENSTQTWLERGRGILRLNDKSCDKEASNAFQSRLVMRTIGSLRVIFNTTIWAGQTIERASQRSIRLSACDTDDRVKIFLIMANPKDADQIFSAIDWRIQQANVEQQKRKQQPENTSPQQMGAGSTVTKTSFAPDIKRKHDHTDTSPTKKLRVDGEAKKVHLAEESNDSSCVDPETEASNESFTSSPTVKSTSSDN